jgi:two-component system response regulator (stage 0 sporulation protein F)
MLELQIPSAATDDLSAPLVPHTACNTHPPAIVVVDDEPDVLTILHRLLRDLAHDHALIAVSTGQAALELLAMCPISLLITDFNMLGMDGLQLIETVKHTSPQTRTVLLTAYDSPNLRQRARAARVDYYLAKPFPLDRLEQIVHETLAAR